MSTPDIASPSILDAHAPAELRREILRLAWPVVLQQVYRSAMFYVDMLMVGRLGTTALAAMGVAGPMIWTLSTVLGALSVGTVAIVARHTGAGEASRSRQDAVAALALAAGVGAVFTIVGWIGAPWAAAAYEMKDSPEATVLAARYMQIISLAFVPMLIELVGSAVLRGAGNTRVPMLIALAANVLNVVGNYALIFGAWGFPRMGVVGAAVSTAVAFTIEGFLVLVFLFSQASPVRLNFLDFRRIDGEAVRRILRLSTPAAVEPLVLQTGFLAYTKVVTGLGATAMAAHRAGIAVESASFMPGFGFSMACAALVGQCLGGGRPAQAGRVCAETTRITMYLMSVFGLVFLLLPRPLVGLFIPDESNALGLAAVCLAWAAFEQPFMGIAMVLGGALRGAGDTRSPVWVAMVGMWAVRLPLAYLLAGPAGLGLVGIWITMIFDWAVRALCFALLYRRGRWRTVRV